jgi:hypothetical protein
MKKHTTRPVTSLLLLLLFCINFPVFNYAQNQVVYLENARLTKHIEATADTLNSFILSDELGSKAQWKIVPSDNGWFYLENLGYQNRRLKASSKKGDLSLTTSNDTEYRTQWREFENSDTQDNEYFFLENRYHMGQGIRTFAGEGLDLLGIGHGAPKSQWKKTNAAKIKVRPFSLFVDLDSNNVPVNKNISVQNMGESPLQYTIRQPYRSNGGVENPYSWIDSNSGGDRFDFSNNIFSNGTGLEAIEKTFVQLPFPFPFYDKVCTKVEISESKGIISFSDVISGPGEDITLDYSISLLDHDLLPNGDSRDVTYFGTPDYFIVQYNNKPSSGYRSESFTGQIILFPDGTIKLQYRKIGAEMALDVKVGVLKNLTETGLQIVSIDQPFLQRGMAITIFPPLNGTLQAGELTNVPIKIYPETVRLWPSNTSQLAYVFSNDPLNPQKIVAIYPSAAPLNRVDTALVSSDTKLQSFPNPTKDYLTLHVNNAEKTKLAVKIIDFSGQIVHQELIDIAKNEALTIDTSKLGKGTYILLVTNSNLKTIVNEKIIKN